MIIVIGITGASAARERGKKRHLVGNLRSLRGASLYPKDVGRSRSINLDWRKKVQLQKMNKPQVIFWKSERDMQDRLPR